MPRTEAEVFIKIELNTFSYVVQLLLYYLDAGFLSWFPCVFKANAEMVPKSKLPLHASHVSLPM